MGRYPAHSRRELRTRFRSWLQRNWKIVASGVAGAMVIIGFTTFWFSTVVTPSPMTWYLLGAVHTTVVAALAGVLTLSFLAHDREAILHVRGAWGEENTRSELTRAQRKRLIWGWVDSVTLQNGDIDHFVVTRAGGLVAIDSKWRNQITTVDQEAMARDASRMRMRAEGVAQSLLKRERGTHRARSTALNVTPLLVVWGAAQHAIPDDALIDGIQVVGGRRLLAWLRQHEGDSVDEHAAHEVLSQLNKFRDTSGRVETPR